MILRTISRSALVAVLFTAIPLSSATSMTSSPESPGAAGAARLSNLKTRGAAEIDRRLTSLTATKTKLGASAKLTESDKTALTTEITAEIAALTTLRTKLQADTDLTVARADVANIVSDYRVYALILPKARLATAADHFTQVEEQLLLLQTKLQAKIGDAKTAGQDTAAMEASLADLGAKIAAAKTATDGFVMKLLSVNPADYNASHAVLATYRGSLVTAQADIKAARDDVKAIVTALKAVK